MPELASATIQARTEILSSIHADTANLKMSRTNPNLQPDFPQLKQERLKKEDNPNIIMVANSREWDAAIARAKAGEFRICVLERGKTNSAWILHVSWNKQKTRKENI